MAEMCDQRLIRDSTCFFQEEKRCTLRRGTCSFAVNLFLSALKKLSTASRCCGERASTFYAPRGECKQNPISSNMSNSSDQRLRRLLKIIYRKNLCLCGVVGRTSRAEGTEGFGPVCTHKGVLAYRAADTYLRC